MTDAPEDPPETEEEPRERRRFQRLGEQLTGLLDPEAAFRRGSGLVTGVTQATKDELIRIVSHEVRNFLDQMDAADLIQQVIAGLVIDVNMQVRFSREGDGPAQPEITRNEAKIRVDQDKGDAKKGAAARPDEG
ncbi:MAG: hypothetical protein AAGF11_41125 [Myxococcota bacterium]